LGTSEETAMTRRRLKLENLPKVVQFLADKGVKIEHPCRLEKSAGLSVVGQFDWSAAL
jgi:hypothetical protein